MPRTDNSAARARRDSRPSVPLVEVVGHSIPWGSVADLEHNGYAYRLARMLGAQRIINRAIPAAVACYSAQGGAGDGGHAFHLQTIGNRAPVTNGGIGDPRSSVVVVDYGINDIPHLGTANKEPFLGAMRAIMSRYASYPVYEAESNAQWANAIVGTGWVNSTTDGAVGRCSGTGNRYTTNPTDSIRFDVPSTAPSGLVWAIGLAVRNDESYVATVKLNGTTLGDVTIDGATRCDPALSATKSWNQAVIRVGTPASTGLLGSGITIAAGDQITLVLKTVTAAGLHGMKVDYAQAEADPDDGPILVVMLPRTGPSYAVYNGATHGPDAGTDPINDTMVQAYATALRSMVETEFPGRCVIVDPGEAVNSGTPSLTDGGVHPNITGHGLIADLAYQRCMQSGLLTRARLARAATVRTAKPFFVPVGGDLGFAMTWIINPAAFANSWVSYGTPYANAGYRRDEQGRVHLSGAVKSGSTASAAMFTLPAGYRPATTRTFIVGTSTGTPATIEITSAGVVSAVQGGDTTRTSLDGISFTAEA